MFNRELKCVPVSFREAIKHVMNLTEPCSAPIEECTFNGVWGGPIRRNRNTRPVYLFSYFWDRAVDVGIIASTEAITWEMQPSQFLEHAKVRTISSFVELDLSMDHIQMICGLSIGLLKAKFSKVPETQLPYLCMDVSYIAILLMDGFKMDPVQSVHLTKQIRYRLVTRPFLLFTWLNETSLGQGTKY